MEVQEMTYFTFRDNLHLSRSLKWLVMHNNLRQNTRIIRNKLRVCFNIIYCKVVSNVLFFKIGKILSFRERREEREENPFSSVPFD
jgi:hypothetical protein